MLPKYCNQCKLQGHAEADCRVIHPELRKAKPIYQGVDGSNEDAPTVPQQEVPLMEGTSKNGMRQVDF